jgi:hypothetical protein
MSSKEPTVNLNTTEHRAEHILYLHSEEFNALRREMYENWQDTFWAKHGWKMVNQPAEFVADMCSDLGLVFIGFDSGDEAGTCLRFLNALRARRGVSSFGRA